MSRVIFNDDTDAVKNRIRTGTHACFKGSIRVMHGLVSCECIDKLAVMISIGSRASVAKLDD